MNGNRLIRTAGAVAALALLFAVTPMWSQDSGGGQGGGYRGHGQMPSPQERADKLSKALSLNDDQKAKALSAYQDEQKQMEALRSDTSTPRDQKRSKMMQIHQGTVDQIKGTLTPDQAKKFDAMQQEMREHYGHHGGGQPEQ